MKLVAIKPIYFQGLVVTENQQFDTQEQHGRELVKKGYAVEFMETAVQENLQTDNVLSNPEPVEPVEPVEPEPKAKKK